MSNLQTRQSIDFASNNKNMVVAYVLWWFLGTLGVHRFYLGYPKTGVLQLLLLALGWLPFFVGWVVLGIWWLIDAYFVYQYVNAHNARHAGSPVALNITTTTSPQGNLEYLEKLHALREKGVLSEDEYQEKRKAVID